MLVHQPSHLYIADVWALRPGESFMVLIHNYTIRALRGINVREDTETHTHLLVLYSTHFQISAPSGAVSHN